MISNSDIEKLAQLAHLSLDQEELVQLEQDLNSILEYVQMLQEVDVSKVEAMSHVHGVTNVFRGDLPGEPLEFEKALSNAPEREGRFFKTPLIIE